MFRVFTGFVLLIAVLGALVSLPACVIGVAGGAAMGASVAPDRRTAGTMFDDQTTKVKVAAALQQERELLQDSHISSMSYNRAVLLVGQTPSEDTRQKVFEAVSNIESVHRVHNEISIGEPTAMSDRAGDGWITTRAKTRLWLNNSIGPGRTSVTTEKGIIYLMGKLTTEEEEEAIKTLQRIPGVENVVSFIDPLNNPVESPIGGEDEGGDDMIDADALEEGSDLEIEEVDSIEDL